MNDKLRRGLTVAGLIAATTAITWWAWPRPALHLRIEPGGIGVVLDRWGRTKPLPETLFVTATGRDTRIRIDNRDSTYQTLGIFGVAARSRRTFRVPLPGSYGGYCSAHQTSRHITYVVQ